MSLQPVLGSETADEVMTRGNLKFSNGDYFGAYQDASRALSIADSAVEPRVLQSQSLLALRAFSEASNVLFGYEDHPLVRLQVATTEKCYNEHVDYTISRRCCWKHVSPTGSLMAITFQKTSRWISVVTESGGCFQREGFQQGL